MSEFAATIGATKLKHAITVLRRVNDESVLNIDSDKIMSRVVDPANAAMVQVTLPADGWDHYVPVEAQVGVDLEKFVSILKRASAKDLISITADGVKTWHFTRGIHRKSMLLFDKDQVRKCPIKPSFENKYTAAVTLTGKEFKEIIAEAMDIADWILFDASGDGFICTSQSKTVEPEVYTGTLPPDRVELVKPGTEIVKSIYTLEFLQDVALDMKASDDVLIRFETDLPCEISYTHDGVEVEYILAPRIESD
jgi:DNA polymerase III sliding clamp (beta) subunit (PCNA family)